MKNRRGFLWNCLMLGAGWAVIIAAIDRIPRVSPLQVVVMLLVGIAFLVSRW
jgi:hypothetical protein